MSLFLILLAAGESKRLKSSTPKPFNMVHNKTLLEHSINAFKNIPEIKKTIIVYNSKHKKYINKPYLKNIIKITGGKTRQDSTLKALNKIKKFNCKKVLIHDAARPSPPKKLIKEIVLKLKKNHAVVPIIKATDATKRIRKNSIFKNINRKSLRFTQTPQGFTFKQIYKKHKKNRKIKYDDDSSLFTKDKKKITIVRGSKKNIKITDNEDLSIFKSTIKKRIFFGIGFDVHRLVPKRKLFLGGLYIKSKLGTLGHSDGDPVLHAVADAILGACRMGDIGEKFSNKNKRYKNISSNIFLKKIISEIGSKNYFINNIDINIITESPKIKNFKKNIIKNIATLCKILPSQINIKGKTTEKLGIIGKEKAIASEVIVSVVKYD